MWGLHIKYRLSTYGDTWFKWTNTYIAKGNISTMHKDENDNVIEKKTRWNGLWCFWGNDIEIAKENMVAHYYVR